MPSMNLSLVLKKDPYDVMVTGEKSYEYRTNTQYWRSRLYHMDGTKKDMTHVHFFHGYQKKRRSFMVEFHGFEIIDEVDIKYSNGLHVKYPYEKNGYIKIKLGKITTEESIIQHVLTTLNELKNVNTNN